MNPEPLRTRIPGALRLQPMTPAELASCLSAKYHSVHLVLKELSAAGAVTLAGIRRRQALYANTPTHGEPT